MHLTITFLSTETGPWQEMYSKNDFLFVAFKTKVCKSNGSWEQQHMLIITITIREFNLTKGRERGPPRGNTKALKNSRENRPSRVDYHWVMGETWLESRAGSTPNSRRNVAWAEWEMLTNKSKLWGSAFHHRLKEPFAKGQPCPKQLPHPGPLNQAGCLLPSHMPGTLLCVKHLNSLTLVSYYISGFSAWVCDQRSKSFHSSSHAARFGQLR